MRTNLSSCIFSPPLVVNNSNRKQRAKNTKRQKFGSHFFLSCCVTEAVSSQETDTTSSCRDFVLSKSMDPLMVNGHRILCLYLFLLFGKPVWESPLLSDGSFEQSRVHSVYSLNESSTFLEQIWTFLLSTWHTSWLLLTILAHFHQKFLLKATLSFQILSNYILLSSFSDRNDKTTHSCSLCNNSCVSLFLGFITTHLFVLCCSTQVNNGHILVVIHIGMVSQTIKVSINDTPSQVHKSPPPSYSPSTLTVLEFLKSFCLLFRCWRAFSPRLQIKGFCWESLTTCVRRILCCACVAGIVLYCPATN